MVKNRGKWSELVDALCPSGNEEDKEQIIKVVEMQNIFTSYDTVIHSSLIKSVIVFLLSLFMTNGRDENVPFGWGHHNFDWNRDTNTVFVI